MSAAAGLVSLAPSAPGDEDAIEDVTLACPECGEEISGKARGAGSASWRLGLHRRNKHGVQGSGKKRRRKGAPTDQDYQAHPLISSVRDMAAEVGGTGTPSGEQLGAAIGRGLGIASMGVAVLAVETDKAITSDAERDQIIDYLSLSDDAAKALARPIGRLLAPTSINKRYGRTAVDNVDVIGSVFELILLGHHWREYFALRAQSNALLAQANASAQQHGMSTAEPHPGVVQHPSGLTHTAPPTEGFVAGIIATPPSPFPAAPIPEVSQV